jgi:hypothetical protein
MKFLLILVSLVLGSCRRSLRAQKGNIDYKPELIEGFANADAVAAINDQKITLFKKIGEEQYKDYSHNKKRTLK